MHVVLVGARPEAIRSVMDLGHELTLLYEGTEHARVAPFRHAIKRACAVDSYRIGESLWSALHHTEALTRGVDAVVSVAEKGVVPAAILGRMLGARALDPETALRCRDKAVQKSAWRRAGIRTADHLVIPDAGACAGPVSRLVKEAGLAAPFILKPLAGGGTANVAAAVDEAELDSLIAATLERDPTMRRLLIESRIGGDEWHVDGVVMKGLLHSIMVSRYRTPLIETKQGRPVATIALQPDDHRGVYAEARDITQRALAALGHTDGVFHFELFGGPGDFVAGELGARPAGHMVSSMGEHVLGFDIWDAAVRVVTGDPLRPPRPVSGQVVGYTAIPTEAGKINRVTRADIASVPGVVDVRMRIQPGAVMPDMRVSSGIRIGTALVKAPSEIDCRAVLDEVVARALAINRTVTPSDRQETVA